MTYTISSSLSDPSIIFRRFHIYNILVNINNTLAATYAEASLINGVNPIFRASSAFNGIFQFVTRLFVILFAW